MSTFNHTLAMEHRAAGLSISEILTNAKELIDTPDKWYPATKTGMCAVHAIICISGCDQYQHIPPILAMEAVISGLPPGYLGSWNDDHTHADVMAVFDRAISAQLENEVSPHE